MKITFKASKLIKGIIVLIIVLGLFKITFLFQNNIKVKTVSVFSSLSFISLFEKINSWCYDLTHFAQLRLEVQNLTQENSHLLAQLTELQILQEENQNLKAALKIKEEQGWKLVPAKIVLVDPTGLTGSFWLDKGTKDGLEEGLNVIMAPNILVGVLKECSDNFCRGDSLFAPQTKISVKDLTHHILAILAKDNQGRFVLELVPQQFNLPVGDVLITSNENPNLLPDLLVAKITAELPSDLALKEYLAEPLVKSSDLSSVLVIISPHFK